MKSARWVGELHLGRGEERGVGREGQQPGEEGGEVCGREPLCRREPLCACSLGRGESQNLAKYYFIVHMQDGTEKAQKVFVSVATEVGQTEAEEIGGFRSCSFQCRDAVS